MQNEGSTADSQVMCMILKTILSTSLKPVLERHSEIITVSQTSFKILCEDQCIKVTNELLRRRLPRLKRSNLRIVCVEIR